MQKALSAVRAAYSNINRVGHLVPKVLIVGFVLMMVIIGANGDRLAKAAPNSTINFQARLLSDSGAVIPDGSYNVEFKIYNSASSSGSSQGSCSGDANCLWVETRVLGSRVVTKNGYLTAALGSVNAFGSGIDWSQELWVTMNVGGTPDSPTWDGEMNPRMKITAVPYSFRSGQADLLTNSSGTIGASGLAQLSQATVQNTTSSDATIRINQQGSGGLLQLQGDGSDVFTVSKTGATVIGSGLTLGNSTSTTAGTIRWTGSDFEGYDGSGWKSLTSGSGGSGSALITKRKTSDVTINSDNTLNDDADLYFAIGVSETWTFRFVIQGNSVTQPDFQFAVTAPSGATCDVGVIDATGANTVSNLGCGKTTGLVAGTGAAEVYEVVGTVVNGSNSGNVTLQWAQNTSNTANTTVYAGSYLMASATSASGALEFLQGGNSFGETAVLGTDDNYGLNIQTNGNNRLTISNSGAMNVIGDLTVGSGLTVTTGGLTVTGDSTITGGLSGLTGLEVVSGGATIIGGLDLDSDGIVNAGSISGVGSDLTATGALTISTAASGDLTLSPGSGLIALNAATLSRVASGETTIALNDSSDTVLRITNTNATAVAGLIVEGAITASGFSGSGASLTALDASNIASGSLADGRLSTNVALLNLSQTFSTKQTFSAGLTLGNTANTTAGNLRWTGTDFEGYDGSAWVSLTSGTGDSGSSNVVTVIKSANETINNSNALQNDDSLKFAIAANDSWTFRFVVKANSGTAPDLKFAITAPSGASCSIDVIDAEGATTASNLSCGTSSGLVAGNGETDTYEVIGSVQNGTNAGDITLQWAQYTADNSDSIVYAGSYVNAIPATDILGISSNAFVQGGNSFGGVAILGTTDSYGLEIVTSGATALALDSLGYATFYSGVTISDDLTVNTNTILNGDTNIGNAASDGLTIYASDITLPNGLNFDSNTLVIDSSVNKVGINNSSPNNLLSINTPNITDNSAQVLITTNGINNKGLVIQGASGQNVNAFEVQNDSGQTLVSFSKSGQLVLGNDLASPQAGTITFNDNTGSNGFTSVLGTNTLSGNRTINLPNEGGTICLANSATCGFILLAPGSAQTDSGTNDSIFINKTGASGSIITLQKNGATTFSVLNSGALLLQLTNTNAFRINNAGGTQFFNVDTSSAIVQIGGSSPDGTGTLFILDTKNTANDPSGTNGAMYYNSSTGENKNRCYEDGMWVDCITERLAGETTLGSANATISISLNGSYESLQCRLESKGRSTTSGVYLRFNSDSGAAAYSWNNYNIVGNAVVDAQDNSDSEIQLNSTDKTNTPFSATINITDFNDVRKGVDWTAIGLDTIGTNADRYSGVGVWDNTSGYISSVQFITSAGTFNAGSHAWCEGKNVR